MSIQETKDSIYGLVESSSDVLAAIAAAIEEVRKFQSRALATMDGSQREGDVAGPLSGALERLEQARSAVSEARDTARTYADGL